jgi:hypothetical protein
MPRWLQRMEGIQGRLDEADVLAGLAEKEGDRWGGAGAEPTLLAARTLWANTRNIYSAC